MNLTRSKLRVADHGEVFTPVWLVEAMLDLVKDETERIDSRFLEPACGSGNFLVPILRRKLGVAEGGFRLPGGPVIPVLALLLCLAFLASARTENLLAGLIALVVGVLIYALRRPPRAPAVTEAE